MKTTQNVLVTCGLPGSGKTTFALRFCKTYGYLHLNSDQVRQSMFATPTYSEAETRQMYATFDERMLNALAHGKDVFYDSNRTNTYVHRKQLGQKIEQAGAEMVIFYFRIDKKIAKRRVTSRMRHDDDTLYKNLDASVVDVKAKLFDEPRQDERFVELHGEDSYETQLNLISQQFPNLVS